MLHYLDSIVPLWLKFTIPAAAGGLAFLADASGEFRGYEEVTLKVFLMGCVVVLGKLIWSQQLKHDATIAATWKSHNEAMDKRDAEGEAREAKLLAAVGTNTSAMLELSSLTKEMVEWQKALGRKAIEDSISKPKLPG